MKALRKHLVLIALCLIAVGCSGGEEAATPAGNAPKADPANADTSAAKQGNAQASPYKAEDLTK